MKIVSAASAFQFVDASAIVSMSWLVANAWALLLITALVLIGVTVSYALTRVALGLQPDADEGALLLIFFGIYLVSVGIFADWYMNLYVSPWWKDLEFVIGGGFVAMLFAVLIWSAMGHHNFK